MISLRGLAPDVRQRAQICLDWAAQYRSYGVRVTVTSTRRTRQEQKMLYDAYRAGRSKWPANPPGQSAHEWGLAWDSVIAPESLQSWWNQVRRAVGFDVLTNDQIHAEVPQWRKLVGLQPG